MGILLLDAPLSLLILLFPPCVRYEDDTHTGVAVGSIRSEAPQSDACKAPVCHSINHQSISAQGCSLVRVTHASQ